MNIKELCQHLRAKTETLEIEVNSLHKHPVFQSPTSVTDRDCSLAQKSEMHANITLAYRHLEDARMRLGKVIQAFDGGISCYTTPR